MTLKQCALLASLSAMVAYYTVANTRFVRRLGL